MKKLLYSLLIVLLIPFAVRADGEPNVATVNAQAQDNGNIIQFNGTTVNSAHAVMCKLIDGTDEIDMQSVEVENTGTDGTFAGTFIAPETGDYTVSCANYEGGTIVTDDVTVSTITQVTVTFNTNGGSEIASATIDAGQMVARPENNPTKDGKAFAGWYEDDTCLIPFDFGTRITASTTIYAKWIDAPIQVQVVFFGEGGTYQVDFEANDSINPDPLGEPVNSSHRYFVDGNKQVTLTAIPAQGYGFAGWFEIHEEDDPNNPGNTIWETGNVISGSATYTFTPTDPYYNVTPLFEVQVTCPNGVGHNNIWSTSGGEISVDYQAGGKDGNNFSNGEVVDYCLGDEITVEAKPNDNYHFVGWYVSNVQQGPEYYYSDQLVSTNTSYTYQPGVTNVTGINDPINYITAVFAENTPDMFTVTFDTNGGGNIAPIDVESGQTVTRPADPVNGDKTFVKWCSDATLTTEFNFNTPITADITLYAVWANTVTFNTNGGSAIAAVQVQDGHKVAKPADPTKGSGDDEKIFDSWYEEAEFEHEYDFNSPVNENITLHAKWLEEYIEDDGNGNEITFVSDENKNLHLVVTDLESLTDEQLLALNPMLDRETFNALLEALSEEAKQYGEVIALLDISIYEGQNPVDIETEVNLKLAVTDEMGDYKYYKLVYVDGDDSGNIFLGRAYKLTKLDDKLTTRLPHLSTYVLVGSNTDDSSATNNATSKDTTTSPKTYDGIMTYIVVFAIAVIGLAVLVITNKKKEVKVK